MQLDDDPGEPVQCDYVLFYKCETLKQWLPVPHGYCIDENAEMNDDTLAT